MRRLKFLKKTRSRIGIRLIIAPPTQLPRHVGYICFHFNSHVNLHWAKMGDHLGPPDASGMGLEMEQRIFSASIKYKWLCLKVIAKNCHNGKTATELKSR